MEPARRATSAEGADIYLNDLDTLLPPGDLDSAPPELAIEASSYPCIDDLDQDQDLEQHLLDYSLVLPSTPELAMDGSSSPNIDWAGLEKIPLYIDPCLQVPTIAPSILPSHAETTMAFQGDSDLQVATIASSSSLSPYASPPTFTSDAITDSEAGMIEVGMMTNLVSQLKRLYVSPPRRMRYSGLISSTIALFPAVISYTIHRLQRIPSTEAHVSCLLSIKLTLTGWQEEEQRITHVLSIPRTKFSSASYKDALPEILEVLRDACITHKLPLAQTWATCAQQGKRCRHHSDENCRYCISTIDAACYVNDSGMRIFHEACSEHHLLHGQGVAGKAFATNKPCFLPDIGSSTKLEYPLSEHAKIFGLKGAVAIRLRCTRTGMAAFVLEFFLPRKYEALEEQNAVLNSLWGTVQTLSKTLRMVTDKEMEDDAMWGMNLINSVDLKEKKKAMKRKPMARRSHVWESFTEVMVGDAPKAKCNYCDLEFCCDSKIHGTSSLRSHLKRCKLNPDNRITGPL